MTGYSRSLGLNGLRTANLKPLGGGIAVECHVLRLKRCWMITVLKEDAAQSRRHNALANVAARSCQHHRV